MVSKNFEPFIRSKKVIYRRSTQKNASTQRFFEPLLFKTLYFLSKSGVEFGENGEVTNILIIVINKKLRFLINTCLIVDNFLC